MISTTGSFLKKNLRAKLRQERNTLPLAVRQRHDYAICATLTEDSRIAAFPQVFFYTAINSEPDLTALAEQWSATKKIALPIVTANGLVFCRWQAGDALVQGEFNIPIPATQHTVTTTADTLVLLPCVALDRYGNRLGYGGGYYDRFLATHPTLCTVGVCYQRFFLEHKLPTRPHDRRVRYIVTEEGLRGFVE